MINPHPGKEFRIQEGPCFTVGQLMDILRELPRRYKVHNVIGNTVSTTRRTACDAKTKIVTIE
jgi:hypothetical protein